MTKSEHGGHPQGISVDGLVQLMHTIMSSVFGGCVGYNFPMIRRGMLIVLGYATALCSETGMNFIG